MTRRRKPSRGKKIKFSFIIPTLNEEKQIGEIIKSIKKMNRKDYEIIVADSYSKDRTVKISRKCKCCVVFEGRKGPGVARNTGAKKAKGSIFIFADADTRFDSDFLDRIEKEFEKPIGGGVCKLTFHDAEKWTDSFFFRAWNHVIKFLNDAGFIMTNGSCFIFDKKAFNAVHGFNPKLLTNEDHDIARRIKKSGRRVKFFDIVVYTSARRLHKMGRLNFLKLQIKATYYYFYKKKSYPKYWSA